MAVELDLDRDQDHIAAATTVIETTELIGHLKKPKQEDGSPYTAASNHPVDVDYTSPATWIDQRRCIAVLVAAYLIWMNVIVVPIACLCTLFAFIYPIKLFSLSLFNKLEHELCRLVNDSWASASKFCGIQVVECGDDIRKLANQRVLCLANHLGLADHFVLMQAFHDKGILAGRYLWVIFNIWRWTPVGMMWTAHGNFFVYGSGVGAEKRAKILHIFRRHLERLYFRHDYGWVVMYPEGSRLYLVQKSEKRFCEKEGLVPFKNCTHPRVGAAHTVLQVCSGPQPMNVNLDESLEYIVDCTLGYYHGIVPHFGQIALGDYPFGPNDPRSSTVALHYRIHKVHPEWRSNQDAFREWLYKRYQLKDKMLEYFYKHGEFPLIAEGTDDFNENELKIEPHRVVIVSMARCVMVHVVWWSLYYFHWKCWLGPVLSGLIKLVF